MAVSVGVAEPVRAEPMIGLRTYGFLGFVTLLNVLNMLDRNLLVVFANDIKADLHLSNGEFGLLSGIMFTLLYGLISPLMGMIADSTHRPRLAAVGVGLWSLLTAASGAARGFVSLALPRIFIGVGESALTPPALSMLADRFPARRLGFASGVYYAGVPLGSGASFLVAGTLGVALGWRSSFLVLGAVGLVLALILGLQPDRRLRPAAPGGAGRAIAGMLALAPEFIAAVKRSPALFLTLLGGVLIHFNNGAAQFDTLWWKEELRLDTGPLFLQVAMLSAVVGIAGSLLGGLVSDWWLKTTGQGRPMLLAAMMLFSTPLIVAHRFTDHAGLLFWLGLGARIFQGAAMYGAVLSTLQELASVRIRATTVAMFILVVNVFGIGISSTIGGYLIDALARAGDAAPIGHVQASLAMVAGLAIPCFYFAARRFSADRDALARSEAQLVAAT